MTYTQNVVSYVLRLTSNVLSTNYFHLNFIFSFYESYIRYLPRL